MRINTLSVAIIILIAFVTFIAYFIIWPWVMLFFGISLLPNPQKPEITYGEFPFRLAYVINGETRVIEDTLICEYDGIGMDEGNGKYRQWKGRLASGNQKILLLNVEGASGIAFGNQKTVNQVIYYDPGPAWYYMGDNEGNGEYKHIFPNASFSEQYQDGSGANGIIQSEVLLEKFNIKLISWEASQPITNNFSTSQ